MKISRSKKNDRKKPAKASPQARFDKAWRKVQKQQQKNAGFRDEVISFARRIEDEIGALERAYVEALSDSCQRMMTFYQRKSLTLWQREVLLEWFAENLQNIVANPFSGDIDMESLHSQFEQAMEKMHPGQPEFAPTEKKARSTETAPPPMDDMFEDLFADFVEDGIDDDGFDADGDEDDLFEEFVRARQASEEKKQQEAKSLNQLMKASSVNTLFRRLASVLHPDREQDEEARQEKNRLMGTLTQARDNNDVVTIFALYAEHVGESPLQAFGDDLDEIGRLLEKQYAYLVDQQEHILDELPIPAVIYRRFHRASEAGVRKELRAHHEELHMLIAEEHTFVRDATSLARLKPYLEERFQMNRFESIFDEIGFIP